MESIHIYDLADELHVRVQLIKDLIRAGKLKTVGNRVVKESADELRWHLAVHRQLLNPNEEDE
ncbi:hypothetical protein ABZ215_25155 [Amycolatopsis sp. NPDC006131]|uniref:hypothetical protein n=1 Tax=Amycolatopsis sp. NPDC006131 TaxID=3156731 RepID=UPI0033ACA916